jgi:hypothetical protein
MRRLLALLLVVGQLTLLVNGCVSVQATGSHAASGPGAGVAVRVFPDDSARRAGRPGPQGVLGELENKVSGRWVPVFRSIEPSWTVAGLPPGRYRLRFPARLDDSGNVVKLAETATLLDVEAGRITEVRAVLQHVPTALVVAGVVAVVVVGVAVAKALQDHDLPTPPPLPPELAEAVFYVSMNLAFSHWGPDSPPPQVTSHFPADNAVVAARRPRVVLSFTQALAPTGLRADGVLVLGEKSGLVEGQVSYDREHWWVVWEPRRDLPPDDVYHVTLSRDAVTDPAGHELVAPVTFSFRTAPGR